MSKVEEIILEIDGKIAYAESVGNVKSKEELIEVKRVLEALKQSSEFKDLEICNNCRREGYMRCGFKPTIVVNGRVMTCNNFLLSSNCFKGGSNAV